jgi:hypothetical protein
MILKLSAPITDDDAPSFPWWMEYIIPESCNSSRMVRFAGVLSGSIT